ncbi:hypothetical protein [Nitratireductor soli]|uniref:hypothetical protein n=1 Tax=Nitratireductor soli TaxID=1670619 RepID=UPI00065E68D5|nr:hypothetical protein [Nitratireductor soli]
MDAIEKAIRNAFDKGDARERAFREKVYRSAFAALERTLQARADMPEEAKRARRDGLKAKITEIETEFMPAARTAAPKPEPRPQPAAEPRPRPTPRRDDDADFVPRVEREDRASPAAAATAKETARRIKAALPGRQRPFAMIYLVATLVAFAGIGIWWAMSSGILLSSEERDTSVRNPPLTLQEEDYSAGEAGSGAQPGSRPRGDWITVFSPADPTTVAAPGNASAEVMQDGENRFLRIGSSADTGVVFDVGQGILETLAGRRAIFAVNARAEDGTETQISISCHFGALGDCGRTRYVVGATRADYLFEVDFPEAAPDGGGTIAIVPDVNGQGRVLDVFAIRAAVASQ